MILEWIIQDNREYLEGVIDDEAETEELIHSIVEEELERLESDLTAALRKWVEEQRATL
jgi:hypothetical protein